MTRFALAVCTLAALSWPASVSAQIACNHGDDNFASAPCCTPVTPNIPNPPGFTQNGQWACIKDCELEAQHNIRITADINPALCDIWVSSVVITPPGRRRPVLDRRADLQVRADLGRVRCLRQPDSSGLAVADQRQPQPDGRQWPVAVPTPPCAVINRAHFHGHYDAACEIDPATGLQVWKHILTLNHLQGCVEHNPFSAVPIPAPFDHPERSYHVVSPAGFTFAGGGEAMGAIPDESWRSLIFPTPAWPKAGSRAGSCRLSPRTGCACRAPAAPSNGPTRPWARRRSATEPSVA